MLGRYTVNIEVVGTCNLRCPSCPVGNFGSQRGVGSVGGTISIRKFGEIITKFKAEYQGPQEDVFVALYSWGEPLIHPRIGDLIMLVREAGFRVGLSSNLNYDRNLAQALSAHPDEFVVSLSGFTQEQYAKSHIGGDIEKVRRNLYALSELVAKHEHQTRVFVHYHCYTHNTENDVRKMAELCEALRFTFMPSIAFYMPVENMLRVAEGKIPPGDADIIEKLLVPMPEQLTIAGEGADARGCELLHARLDIDVDGAVKLCCATYDRASNVAPDFLAVALEDVQRRRNSASLCGPCMKTGINRIYTRKDYRAWCRVANKTLASLDRPFRFTDAGYEIDGFESESTLLSRVVALGNAGQLDEAAAAKTRLDVLVCSKYGADACTIAGLRSQLDGGHWVRGATIPSDPLLYFFMEAVLLRNHRASAAEARNLLNALHPLIVVLSSDAEYAPHAGAVRAVVEEWRTLPV